MSESRPLSPSDLFDGYELRQNTQPGMLHLNEAGILQDDKHLFLFRRSIADLDIDTATPSDLYNGTSPNKKFNATEGHGLYAANTPTASAVWGIKGNVAYCIRMPLENTQVLDTNNPTDLTLPQQKAARHHRVRSRMIGVPSPGTKQWDEWYQDADIVIFRPMALARILLKDTATLDVSSTERIQMRPVWTVIRKPEKADIIAKKRT